MSPTVQMDVVDDFMTPLAAPLSRARSARPSNVTLSPETLRVSAEWILDQADRLTTGDAQFARGMAALLREGRRLTPKQVTRLVLLTSSLLP